MMLETTERTGSRQYHANVLESLGAAYALMDGGFDRALPLYRECMALFMAVGDKPAEAGMCERMAQIAAWRGQTRRTAMRYTGSCHCGQIRFEVEGEIDQLLECNCSFCSRKAPLLWFVPRDKMRLLTPADKITTYQFNRHLFGSLQTTFADNDSDFRNPHSLKTGS